MLLQLHRRHAPLPLLQDSSRDIREALHELICYTNVSTKECIQLALLELLKNLSKYPTDRNSVWKYGSSQTLYW